MHHRAAYLRWASRLMGLVFIVLNVGPTKFANGTEARASGLGHLRALQQSSLPPSGAPSPNGNSSMSQQAQTAGGGTFDAIALAASQLCGGRPEVARVTTQLASQVGNVTSGAYARGVAGLPNAACDAVAINARTLAFAVSQALASGFSSVSIACSQVTDATPPSAFQDNINAAITYVAQPGCASGASIATVVQDMQKTIAADIVLTLDLALNALKTPCGCRTRLPLWLMPPPPRPPPPPLPPS
ncbi:hypothetical protein V8C86DRAFT_3128413, partial [Haematococcus lacustris]